MNEALLHIIIVSGAVIVCMFIIAMVAALFIKRAQSKKQYNSLPSGGADRSEFSERLAEKYRNERLK
jgi:hypothetical protein